MEHAAEAVKASNLRCVERIIWPAEYLLQNSRPNFCTLRSRKKLWKGKSCLHPVHIEDTCLVLALNEDTVGKHSRIDYIKTYSQN